MNLFLNLCLEKYPNTEIDFVFTMISWFSLFPIYNVYYKQHCGFPRSPPHIAQVDFIDDYWRSGEVDFIDDHNALCATENASFAKQLSGDSFPFNLAPLTFRKENKISSLAK